MGLPRLRGQPEGSNGPGASGPGGDYWTAAVLEPRTCLREDLALGVSSVSSPGPLQRQIGTKEEA